MQLDIFQIDAFTDAVFGGNPAAVCPLDYWLPDSVLQNIAAENNLSETAFFVRNDQRYHLRWFTPNNEVELCGHATLASAYVLFEILNYSETTIEFTSPSGSLFVQKSDDGITMNFPIWHRTKTEIPDILVQILGKKPLEYFNGPDNMAVFENPSDIRNINPDFLLLKQLDARGLLITAKGDNGFDFISRAFFPKLDINEDPVTGSAHCLLAPYWAEKLGRTKLKAYQTSKRGGSLLCELKNDRVFISGNAVPYLKGIINVR